MKIQNTKIILNCLAGDLQNAIAIYNESNGDALLGLLTKDFDSNKSYIKQAKKWNKALHNNVSVGLGGGSPKQSFMVSEVVKSINANHINQVFTGVGMSSSNKKNKKAIVNALISPTGTIGKVKISTGPESSLENNAIIDAETAVVMVKDMGGDSIKFFNMKGLKHFEESKKLIQLCKKHNLIFEPTGGLDIDTGIKIIKECIKVGLNKVIVHIYSSIIDKKTNMTKIEDVKEFWNKVKNI